MPVRSLWKKQWGTKCKQCIRMLLVPDKVAWSWLSWQSEEIMIKSWKIMKWWWDDDEMMKTWGNYEKDCQLPRRLGRLSWPNAFPWPPWMIRIRSCLIRVATAGERSVKMQADRSCAVQHVIQLDTIFLAGWLEQPVLLIVCAWTMAKSNLTVQLTF